MLFRLSQIRNYFLKIWILSKESSTVEVTRGPGPCRGHPVRIWPLEKLLRIMAVGIFGNFGAVGNMVKGV